MNYDPKETAKIRSWLETPAADRDIPAGALLLLRLNRNRIFYNNVLRKPDKLLPKLEYELKKYLRIREDEVTMTDVVKLQREILPRVDKELSLHGDGGVPQYRGKRKDHDQLPERIRQMYEENGIRYRKIRQIREDLFAMDNRPWCDRYEYLKILEDLDRRYRETWAAYDHAKTVDEEPADSSPRPVYDVNVVNAARKYVSEHRAKLAAVEPHSPKAVQLRAAMQQRVNLVLQSGGKFAASTVDELTPLGISFTQPEKS